MSLKKIFLKDEEECCQLDNGIPLTIKHSLISKMLKCEKMCALKLMTYGK